MKINLNKSATKSLIDLFNTLELNMSASDIALQLVDGFENLDLIEAFESINTHAEYVHLIKELYAYDESDPFQKTLFTKHLLPAIKQVYLSDYQDNSYYQTIKSVEFSDGNTALTLKHYRKNQLLIFDDVTCSGDDFKENISLAYSPVDYPYLALIQDDKIWMAIIPHEINTMKDAIEEAHGDVLVLGLGLGYYPFMIASKDNVKSITIIENDQNIIDIFTKYILPTFPHQNIITIIKDDAFSYMKKEHHKFDFAFFDIYRSSNEDLALYLQAKQNEKYYPHLTINYWLENSMIAHLRRIVITYIQEVYYDYQPEEISPLDKLIDHVAHKLKDVEINSYDEIVTLLQKERLINLFL